MDSPVEEQTVSAAWVEAAMGTVLGAQIGRPMTVTASPTEHSVAPTDYDPVQHSFFFILAPNKGLAIDATRRLQRKHICHADETLALTKFCRSRDLRLLVGGNPRRKSRSIIQTLLQVAI